MSEWGYEKRVESSAADLIRNIHQSFSNKKKRSRREHIFVFLNIVFFLFQAKILGRGTYDELKDSGIDFASLLNEEKILEDETDDRKISLMSQLSLDESKSTVELTEVDKQMSFDRKYSVSKSQNRRKSSLSIPHVS